MKVTGPAATHGCKDGDICAVFKADIYGVVHRATYIWDASSTEENWGFLLIDKKKPLIRLIESECCGQFVIYGHP